MIRQIDQVEARPGYQLHIVFKGGQQRLFDVKPYLDKGLFRELRNESYFKKVRAVWGGVEWPREQDLSADTLYFGGIPVHREEKELQVRERQATYRKKTSRAKRKK